LTGGGTGRGTPSPPVATRGHTRVYVGVIADDVDPEKPSNLLKTNALEKRRNHRQKSSKVVKTDLNSLIYNVFQ